ncbi:homoserine O-acetyltransferase [Haloferax sp. MBLA0076]|uniref:Homoserine O-acetyltransferase n=1 Tax=Haloferax litoreum TaxID=2666140 RepID=A0A6A8GEW7_9EURY|nr:MULTISPECIES: homoserine O-acetyltransferase [Haloferax]KAB1192906.1 homoserine O-acetyltransferase [Haloferax sp. CBA1148]MRX21391.1 homoserine O-acetyltransferase [Haloferax litoreum]
MSRTRTAPGRRVESDVVDVGEFQFESGEIIPNLHVAYEAYGEFTGDNAIVVCHALTGSQHVASLGSGSSVSGQARAWWSDIVGPGKAIDTNEYYVVCVNVPGSCYGTSGPASEGPDGEPWGTDFPPVTVSDWTRAQRLLLDHLGIGRLHAVVGGSVGGMNALDWAVQYPDDVDRLVVVAAAARLDPQCLGLDAVARRAITTDPNWNGGDYYGDDHPDPEQGLGLARQIGHLMYLSKDSMDRKFGRRSAGRGGRGDTYPADPAAAFFPYREVESYLDYQAEKFAERFDANSYLYLTRAMDDFDLSEGYESDAAALAAFEGEALLISFTGDWHFTTEQSESLAEAFRRSDAPVAHHVVESDHGHDAFLVEPEKVGPPLGDFLTEGVAGRAVTDTVADGGEPESEKDFAPVHSSLFSR